jgi:hypothetical protein
VAIVAAIVVVIVMAWRIAGVVVGRETTLAIPVLRELELREFVGFESLGGSDLYGVRRCCLLDQLYDLRQKAGAVGYDQVGAGYRHTVLGSSLVGVDVSAWWYQVVDRYVATSDIPHQVGDHCRRGNHFDRLV